MLHLVVSYDVVCDRRRNRLCKLLKGKLERVQKSVFEGDLPQGQLPRLERAIAKLIDMEEDSVRIYRICGRCQAAIQIIGWGTVIEPPDEDVIV